MLSICRYFRLSFDQICFFHIELFVVAAEDFSLITLISFTGLDTCGHFSVPPTGWRRPGPARRAAGQASWGLPRYLIGYLAQPGIYMRVALTPPPGKDLTRVDRQVGLVDWTQVRFVDRVYRPGPFC